MANEYGHALVPIYITKKGTSTGTALYSTSRLVYEFVVQKSTVATAITIGTTSGGVKLQAGDSISFNSISQKYGPTQYDLASFYAVSNAVSSVSINIMALVKKSQATNPPS
jgi:hypothetical protein